VPGQIWLWRSDGAQPEEVATDGKGAQP
jgi:hypothetical protein